MMNKLNLTVLVENTAQGHGLLAEHGLAFWLGLGSRRILFDTGQTGIVCLNANRLGIDLGSTSAIVLSHGHYDHTGGLVQVLKHTGRTQVFAHPEVLTDKFARNADGTSRNIGMSAQTRTALKQTAVVTPTETPTEIGDGMFATGPVPRLSDFEDTGGPFFKDADCRQPDDLIDDQAVFVETPDGIVVILGCAHAGIINTLRYIRKLLPERLIHTVIGGTHLVTADAKRLDRTVDALRDFEIQRLVPLHCTGFPAAARLWNKFPGRVSTCPVGATLELAR